jgi:class 3 adenylate cyclase/tetratricopeptide (TPR) repeat protein
MALTTVSVLFTDLVGSTELLSRVGEATADELRREHFTSLRGAIGDAGGREVKNLGDGLMVVFDGAVAALACAVAMQQAMEARPVDAERLSIRVGVSVGEAESEDGDFFGLPVVEAARLCAKAGGGEILTTEMVRLLTRSRGGFDLEAVGELELKGLDDPVAAFRVRWEPIDPSAGGVGVPVPQRLVSVAVRGFVGRDDERERMVAALKDAAGGDRRAVLVGGEPGIGKTTLAASFAMQAAEAGATVLYGRCDEDLFVPYQPWVEALDHLVAHLPDDVLAAHVEASGTALGRVLPALARRVGAGGGGAGVTGSSSGESDRPQMFAAVVDLLARAAERAPVVLLLDDLHWADAATTQLLRHVLTVSRALPLLVIGTFRDSEVGPDHDLADTLAVLHREHGVDRVALRGLGDDELLRLLEQTAGHEMNDEGVALRDALLAETDGNPFFVGEMLRHLAETGGIYQDESGHWTSTEELRTGGLPISIREVVGRRVLRLGPETQRVLTLASVIGRDFDLDLLERVVDVDADHLVDLCDAAVAAAVLQEQTGGEGYTFVHALIYRSLYDTLSRNRQARAHRAIAHALEELCGNAPGDRIGQLAHHWAQATRPTDTAKAVDYACQAGSRALAGLAPDEALDWYTRALEMLDADPDPAVHDPAVRAQLLVDLGDAQRQCGVPAYRETLLDAAHLADQIDDIDLLVRAALTNHRGFAASIGTSDTERLEVLDLALERLGDSSSADRARLLAQSCMEQAFTATLDDLVALAEQAIDTARRSGDPAALVDTLTAACYGTMTSATLDRRIAWSDEACGLADTLGDPAARFHAHREGGTSALENAQLDELRAHRVAMEEISDRLPHAGLRWISAFHRVVPAVLAGDLDDAERLAGEALTLGFDSGQPDAMAIYGPQLINIRSRQGRLGEMVSLIDQAATDNPGLPALRTALAAACLEAGDHDRARQIFEEARDLGFPAPENTNWSTMHYYWSDLAIHFGDRRAAETLHERVTPYADHIVTTQITVSPVFGHFVAKLEHLLGRYDDADASFQRALAIHERLESPVLVAMTWVAWAAMLADRADGPDLDHARSLGEQALEVADRSGYGTVARDARAVLDKVG